MADSQEFQTIFSYFSHLSRKECWCRFVTIVITVGAGYYYITIEKKKNTYIYIIKNLLAICNSAPLQCQHEKNLKKKKKKRVVDVDAWQRAVYVMCIRVCKLFPNQIQCILISHLLTLIICFFFFSPTFLFIAIIFFSFLSSSCSVVLCSLSFFLVLFICNTETCTHWVGNIAITVQCSLMCLSHLFSVLVLCAWSMVFDICWNECL